MCRTDRARAAVRARRARGRGLVARARAALGRRARVRAAARFVAHTAAQFCDAWKLDRVFCSKSTSAFQARVALYSTRRAHAAVARAPGPGAHVVWFGPRLMPAGRPSRAPRVLDKYILYLYLYLYLTHTPHAAAARTAKTRLRPPVAHRV